MKKFIFTLICFWGAATLVYPQEYSANIETVFSVNDAVYDDLTKASLSFLFPLGKILRRSLGWIYFCISAFKDI